MSGVTMGERTLMKGNEAIVRGALAAGLQCYFGYPITPQNDIPELLSDLLPKQGGQFVQAESEIASANMLIGAAGCGVPCMTSTSGPGFSLMMEAISFMIGQQIPTVIVNMMRGGPGLGDIGTSQGDYSQAVKCGAHGDGFMFVLAPSSAQECYDMAAKAFDIAFTYKNPVLILGDALVAQIKEPVKAWQPAKTDHKVEDWCLMGNPGNRPIRLLKTNYLGEGPLAEHLSTRIMPKYASMQKDVMFESTATEDADLIVVAFGSIGRIAKSSMEKLRAQGHKVGVLRPQTLFPYPSEELARLGKLGKRFLVIEQNYGQMIEDVRLALRHIAEPEWYGVGPGFWPSTDDLVEPILNCLRRRS